MRIIRKHGKEAGIGISHSKLAAEEIIKTFPQIEAEKIQGEQLEVRIKESKNWHEKWSFAVTYDSSYLEFFETKQEALDWCAKYNLKIKD